MYSYFSNTDRQNSLIEIKRSLGISEFLRKIAQENILNSRTLGYKTLVPEVTQETRDSFGSIFGRLSVKVRKDQSPGKSKIINGKKYQESTVDINKQLRDLVNIALMNKSILTTFQLSNKIKLDIINTLGNTR